MNHPSDWHVTSALTTLSVLHSKMLRKACEAHVKSRCRLTQDCKEVGGQWQQRRHLKQRQHNQHQRR